MAYRLNLKTREITQVTLDEAQTAMKNFGYEAKTISRLAREATIFYTGDAFYSRDRYRLDEEVRESRENAATALQSLGTAPIQNLYQLSPNF